MATRDDHPGADTLAAFARGELGLAEQAGVEAHVADCDACCRLLREVPDDALMGRLRGARLTPVTGGPRRRGHSAKDHTPPIELLDHPRYKIGRFLGSGGMGVVYQAEHRLMERPVALKIIHRDLLCHARALEQFRQEVKAAARLAHPNIVAAYDADQAGEAHFLAMELVDGISLAQLVKKRGPLGVTHACNYVRQAAQGLQHAFEAGMVHRDIKPHNLMLTRKGQIKILDFGLARLASAPDIGEPATAASEAVAPDGHKGQRRKSRRLVMGTPDFMAPEQAANPAGADIRADIYSLGCTLYFVLAGQSPSTQGSALAKLLAREGDAYRRLREARADLPPELAGILARMMAKDPVQRFQTPADVVKALTALAKPGPEQTTPKPEEQFRPYPTPAQLRPASDAPEAAASSKTFLAACGYCPTEIRVPQKGLGASVLCPNCGNYFTAVPRFF